MRTQPWSASVVSSSGTPDSVADRTAGTCPTTITPALARAMATLRRRASLVKPTLPLGLALTMLIATRSASCPWAASTVETRKRRSMFPQLEMSWVWALYIDRIMAALPCKLQRWKISSMACACERFLTLPCSPGPFAAAVCENHAVDLLCVNGATFARLELLSRQVETRRRHGGPWEAGNARGEVKGSNAAPQPARVELPAREGLDARAHAVLGVEHDRVS